jgi:hypothetical protein
VGDAVLLESAAKVVVRPGEVDGRGEQFQHHAPAVPDALGIGGDHHGVFDFA